MSAVWWGKEAGPADKVRLAANGVLPELMSASRATVAAALRTRVSGFTPEWTAMRPGDAGFALLRLFSAQMEPVLQRLNRLPEKAAVEFLSMAGVSPLPATPAQTYVEFEIAEAAPASVLIPEGFQLGARPAGGSDLVIFETERTIYGAPAAIAEMYAQTDRTAVQIDLGGDPATSRFLPFGEKPGPGSALLIGLSGETTPSPSLALGIRLADSGGAPPPVSAGGVAPLPVPPPPVLQWEALDGTSFEPAEIESDGTAGLTKSGVIELRLPSRWRPGRPSILEGHQPLRWLRLRIVYGTYRESPALAFVRLNMVRAIAARTVFDEILQPVAGSGGNLWQLSQTPVLAGTLQLVVDESDLAGEDASGQAEAGTTLVPWREVSDLAESTPEQRHYVLDPVAGIVTFGNGLHGKAVPPGFRHVRAQRYQVGGGSAGAAAAGAVSTLLSSAPFLISAKNPLAASGGMDRGTQQEAVKRGPQEIRARGRAVTVADYELLAARAPGAQVARAHAVAGLHPAFPGRPIPGVVGVFVIPPQRGEGAPMPDQESLSAVAEYLAQEVAPAGVEVVAAAPRYHRVRVEVAIVLDAAANAAETVRRIVVALDNYLHPLTGGEDGQGWPFGGALGYAALLRLTTHVSGVHAVERLNLVVDGVRIPTCIDHAISAHGLLWSDLHQVVIVQQRQA